MKKISAVIAAAGLGTRLKDYKDNSHTKVLIKIRQSSMISEQISQLSGWGIERFVIIANPEFYSLIKDDIDVNHADKDINYAIQEKPLGIAHALLQSKDLIENNSKILFILGDNFFGENPIIDLDINKINNSVLFLKEVKNPQEFGVAQVEGEKIINIVEKPTDPTSNLAVVGIYLYDYNCFELISKLEFSKRGELEITDLNNLLIQKSSVDYKILKSWWIDAGTEERIESLKKLL
jgi:glucose-1-phosphate thymidylyltransferase|tara:strand:+ start:130 stop:837 length:708 start_codon:yes stop_codon:yes gene_type:complete